VAGRLGIFTLVSQRPPWVLLGLSSSIRTVPPLAVPLIYSHLLREARVRTRLRAVYARLVTSSILPTVFRCFEFVVLHSVGGDRRLIWPDYSVASQYRIQYLPEHPGRPSGLEGLLSLLVFYTR